MATSPASSASSWIRVIFGAIICGLLSAAIALAGLIAFLYFGFESFLWDRFYATCGFPAIGVFCVMAAAYIIAHLTGWSIGRCVVIVAVWNVMIWVGTNAFSIAPTIVIPTDKIHWYQPAFVLWLSLPSLSIVLIALFGYTAGKGMHKNTEEQS